MHKPKNKLQSDLQRSFKRRYFEGWYFKHHQGDLMLALIPGIHIDKNGMESAFIQIIMNDNSYYIPYSIYECYIDRRKPVIKMGNTIFCDKGIKVDIDSDGITVKGFLKYGALDPIKYSIMGLFRYIPFMECKHEILSMYHVLHGKVRFNDKLLNFNNGIGYIEKDWGHSFPISYQWLHCNHFKESKCSVIVSVANIPFLGRSFKGCICLIHFDGKEYRLTTYLGVKIINCNEKEICLLQGKYLLKINILSTDEKEEVSSGSTQAKLNNFSHKLKAPVGGNMSRIIYEQHFCRARFILYKGKEVVFDLESNETSLEIVE